jgi:tetratricopeptide (TPR) repeat protein
MNRAFCIGHFAFLVTLCGCGPKSETIPSTSPAQTRSTATPADRQAMRAVSLPDLSRMEKPVQEQMREAYSSLLLKRENPATPASDLGHAYGELGNLLLAAEYLDAAEACYADAQALDPAERRWPYYLGHIYETRGDLAGAARSFERALELRPADEATLVWLGVTYLDQGRPDAAATMFTQAVALQPRSVAALVGQGRAALARRDYGRAADSLEQALAVDPRASMVHYPLALAYRGMGNIERAEAHLRQRGDVEIGPSDPLMQELAGALHSAVAYENAGVRALDGGDWAVAASSFRKAIELAPDSGSLRHRLGTALSLSGDIRGAAEQFQEAVRLSPGYAPAHFSLGVLFAGAERYSEAIAQFSAAVTDDPSYVEAHLQLAEVLQRTGHPDASLPHYVQVIKIDPRAAAARFGYAMALIRMKRYEEARARLTEDMKIHPDRPEFAQALERLKLLAPEANGK